MTPIPFCIEKSGVSGKVSVEDDGTIFAAWYEWHGEDDHRVLQAIGDALGFPVVFECLNNAGNGHCSATLQKATVEEAIIQAKIAACFTLEYWNLPKQYKRLPGMLAEIGPALLHQDDTVESAFTVLAIDVSKIDKKAFFQRWSRLGMQDALEAARAADWDGAIEATHLPVCYAPRSESADPIALEMILRLLRGGESKRRLAESSAIVFTRSYGASFGHELQASLDRMCIELKQPQLFDVRGIVQRFLDEAPERRKRDLELVAFLKAFESREA